MRRSPKPSATPAPTICSQSRPTSRRLRAEVEACFADARPAALDDPHRPRQGPRPHRAAHRQPSCGESIGFDGDRRFPANCACPASPASSASRPASSGPLHARDPLLHLLRRPRRRTGRRRRCAATGASKTASLGPRRHLRRRPVPPAQGLWRKNMAVVRHFALNLVRAAKDKHSIRLRRKLATWTPAYLEQLLNANTQ